MYALNKITSKCDSFIVNLSLNVGVNLISHIVYFLSTYTRQTFPTNQEIYNDFHYMLSPYHAPLIPIRMAQKNE